MRRALSWKDGDGGALLPPAFVMMLIATLVSAEYPPITSVPDGGAGGGGGGGGGGGITCSSCAVNEDNYRGPTWAYPCMKGYQGPKSEDIKCDAGKSGCFRQLFVHGGKKVIGKGGCFDYAKKECIEKVTKAKLNENGCIPETDITPPMLVDLRKDCGIDFPSVGQPSPAAARRRKREDAEGGVPKGVICVCEGSGCNNKAGGFGRSAEDSSTPSAAVPSTIPISVVWIGVFSGVTFHGRSFLANKRT